MDDLPRRPDEGQGKKLTEAAIALITPTSQKIDAAAAAWGFTEEDMGGPPGEVGIWPDNMDAVKVFSAMGTQWRTGMGGATGLDYGVLPSVFRITGIARKDQSDVFDDLRVMEGAALEHWHKDS